MVTNFDWAPLTRLVFGAGSVDRLGELAAELGGQRVFVVTDPGLVAAGHVARAEHALTTCGLETRRYEASENPTSADVDACRAALGDWNPDVLIGFGGGSSIDVAKGCNFVHAGGGRMEDYWGKGKAKGDLLPLIAVPTTAGTGTEVQSFALIEQDGTHQKMACGDLRATPAVALLDPELTLSQPPFVTACTGLDALGHAVETAVTKAGTAISHAFSLEAFRLINAHFSRVLAQPDDLEARGAMLMGATLAGLAIENSMLGAAHSMANPLTAHHDLAHGQAVAFVLPTVVRHNAAEPTAAASYAELARVAQLGTKVVSDAQASEQLALRIEQLIDTAGFDRSLANHGVLESAVNALAHEAARQWTASFNPRPVAEDEFRQLFRDARA